MIVLYDSYPGNYSVCGKDHLLVLQQPIAAVPKNHNKQSQPGLAQQTAGVQPETLRTHGNKCTRFGCTHQKCFQMHAPVNLVLLLCLFTFEGAVRCCACFLLPLFLPFPSSPGPKPEARGPRASSPAAAFPPAPPTGPRRRTRSARKAAASSPPPARQAR